MKGKTWTLICTQGGCDVKMKADRIDASTSEGTQGIVSKLPEVRGESWNGFVLRPLRRQQPYQHFFSDF